MSPEQEPSEPAESTEPVGSAEPAEPAQGQQSDEATDTAPPAREADPASSAAAPFPPAGAAAYPPPVGPPVPAPGPAGGPVAAPLEPTGAAPAAASVGSTPTRKALAGAAMVALALASGLVGAFTATALDDDERSSPSESLSSTIAPASEGDEAPQATEPLSRAAEAVLPSVVSVGFDSEIGTGQGSGVVISSDGQILTNNHVVAAADDGDLTVTFADGTRTGAEVVGTDPASDLAVIQAQDVDGLTPATLGRSGDLVVGDTVLAIGSPLGLDGSVSAGIVSALNRAIDLGQSEQPLPSPFEDEQEQEEDPSTPSAVIDAIQTDAAINPGNSGGPLINTDGEVVGVNTAIASLAGGVLPEGSGNIGLGFAIPIDDAREIAEQLIEDGEATHAYMGVRIAEVEPSDDEGPSSGAVVAGVEQGSPAAEAGLEEGDVITEVDGEAVRDPAALTSAIRSHAPGDQVSLGVTRDGEETTVDVTLGTLPTGDS